MKDEVRPTAPKENRMRVAQIALLVESIPPKLDGGTEWGVSEDVSTNRKILEHTRFSYVATTPLADL